MNIKEIMTTDVKSCTPDSTLDSVAMMMWDNDCGSIAVVEEDGMPVGMITDRDIAMGSALNHKPLWEISTREITNDRPVHICDADDDVKQLLKVMQTEKVRRVPVVNGDGKVEGIVSTDDLVAFAKNTGRNSTISYEDAMETLKAVSNHH